MKDIDGFVVPTRVAAHIEAEQRHHASERHRVVRMVAASSTGTDDCRELLDMLGLSAAEGRTAVSV